MDSFVWLAGVEREGCGLDYEFKNIEELVRSAVDSVKGPKKKGGKSLSQIRNAVEKEVDRVKGIFLLRILEFDSDEKASRFVQFHQFSLVNLLDNIDKVATDHQPEPIIESLTSLLKFLRTSWPKDFQNDIPAPTTLRDKSLHAAKSISERIRSTWGGTSIDSDLVAVLQESFDRFIKSNASEITFRKIDFMKRFGDQTGRLLSKPFNPDAARKMLMELNVNDDLVRDYLFGFLRNEVNKGEALKDQLEILGRMLKELNQTPEAVGCSFDHRNSTLRTQVSNWILDEIHFLETKSRIANQPKKPDFANEEFKLIFDLSVAQFALLVRSLIESNVIQNRNLSEILRFLAKFSKTKRSENISYESLRIKYYNIETGTKETVKMLLNNCLSYIET